MLSIGIVSSCFVPISTKSTFSFELLSESKLGTESPTSIDKSEAAGATIGFAIKYTVKYATKTKINGNPKKAVNLFKTALFL